MAFRPVPGAVILLILCLPTFTVLVSGQQPSPDDEVCQSILEVTSSSSTEPDCQPLGDCTGLSCYSTTSNKTVEIAVNKCTDPLVVNVTVYDDTGSSVYITEQVTGTGDIGSTGYRVDTFTRDELMATISISYSSNGVDVPAVPSTSIPLNASTCMCEAIKHAGDNVEAPSTVSCTPNHQTECTGQECQFTVFIFTYLLETELIACNDPPGVEFILRNSNMDVVSEDYFDKNSSRVLLNMPLEVTVIQKPFSIVLAAMLLYSGQWYNIVPMTQIILDKTECIVPTTTTTIQTSTTMTATQGNATNSVPVTTVTPSSVPVPQQISPQTCEAIEGIRDQVNTGGLTTCTIMEDCGTLSCVTLGLYTSSFQLLPCHAPPAIHAILRDKESKIYDGVLTNTTIIPVSSNGNALRVGLEQKENAIAFKLDADLGFSFLPVIQETDIPIDTCYCTTPINCTYLTTSSTTSTTSTVSTDRASTTTSTSLLLTTTTTETGRPRPTTDNSTSIPPTARGQALEVTVAISVPVVLIFVGVVGITILLVSLVLFFKLKLKSRSSVAHSNEDTVAFKDMIYSQEDSLSEISLEVKNN